MKKQDHAYRVWLFQYKQKELKLRQYNNQETEINYNFDTSLNKNINTARL